MWVELLRLYGIVMHHVNSYSTDSCSPALFICLLSFSTMYVGSVVGACVPGR